MESIISRRLSQAVTLAFVAMLALTVVGIPSNTAQAAPPAQGIGRTVAQILAVQTQMEASGGLPSGGRRPRYTTNGAPASTSEDQADFGSLMPSFIAERKAAASAKVDNSPALEAPVPVSAATNLGQAPFDTYTRLEQYNDTGYAFIPPDTMGAVGPTQFVTAANVSVLIQNKNTGARDFPLIWLNAWFSDVFTPDGSVGDVSLFDTRIRYDRLSGKWFITAINGTDATFGGVSNKHYISVVDDPIITPSTIVRNYYYQGDLVTPTVPDEEGCFYDFGTFAVDANALYAGMNIFDDCYSPGLGFVSSSAFVIQKAPLVNNTASSQNLVTAGLVRAFRDVINGDYGFGNYDGMWTPLGVDSLDTSSTDGWLIGPDACCFTLERMVVRRISNPGSSNPTLGPEMYLYFPETEYPPNASHLGNNGAGSPGGLLETGDGRVTAATLRNGRMYFAHEVGVYSDGQGITPNGSLRSSLQWWEVDLTTGTPTVVQRGILYDPAATPMHYFYPALNVSGQGNILLGFTQSNQTIYPAAAAAYRLASEAPNTMGPATIYQPGRDSYNTAANGRKRWGDYSYTSVDPCDDMSIWTLQEFTDVRAAPLTSGVWNMSVGKFMAPAPTITAVNPPSVATGASSVTVVLTGTGFFNGFRDPACTNGGLAASITGVNGAVVTGVQYVSPTEVRITLSTAAVSANGTATVYLRNPDGQETTAIFTIASGGSTGPIVGTTPTGPVTLPATGYEPAPDTNSTLYVFGVVLGLLMLCAVVVIRRRR